MHLPLLRQGLEQGIEDGLHLGAQVYISLQGQVLAHWALGEAKADVPLGEDSLMLWLSSSKPIAAVAIAQLWERGALDLDDRVVQYIPEFGAHGKEAITLRHVLTHTGGFRSRIDLGWGEDTWDKTLEQICAARLERDWYPGRKAAYHINSGWFVLGEVVRRLDGRPYEQYAREEIFAPAGMTDTWFVLSREQYETYGERLCPVYDTSAEGIKEVEFWNEVSGSSRCIPGASGRGCMRDLGRFYEMIFHKGVGRQGQRLLAPQTVDTLTARHRVGLFDETFKHVMDWGLGFVANSTLYGVESVPYGYGRHASPRTFGHSGQQSSVGFADPDCGLVVAMAVNGMPGAGRHHKRFLELNSAIYEDLGLTVPLQE